MSNQLDNNEDYINKNDDENYLNSYSDDYLKDKKQETKKNINYNKKAEKKRLKKKARKNKMFFRLIWISMVIIVALISSEYIMQGVRDMLAITRQEDYTTEISIPKDATPSQVSNILYKAGVISNPKFFKKYITIIKPSTNITKGDYEIKTNLEYEEIISYLNTLANRSDYENITFTEGMSILEFAEILDKHSICDKNEFLQKCNSSEYDEDYPFLAEIKNSDKRYYRLEGYLFPDTYTFYQDISADSVIRKCLSNFNKKMIKQSTVNGYSSPISIKEISEENGLSLDELITLSSMVQSECADKDDMKTVASIFLNRLNSDVDEGFLYLNSDPTVYYPYKNKESAPNGFESTYDTYKHKGLPNGPICNPGMEAIDAVLNPSDTNYYYFCHDKNGNAYYATTEKQHIANLKKAGLS